MSGIVLNELTKGIGADDIEYNHERTRGIRSVDALHQVSSLGILQPDFVANESLWESMNRNLYARRFLKHTANYWIANTTLSSLCTEIAQSPQKSAHSVAVVASRVLLAAEILYLSAALVITSVSYSKNDFVVNALILVANLLDLACIAVSQHLNHGRLTMPAHFHDQAVIEESARISAYFLGACYITVVVSTVIFSASAPMSLYENIIYFLFGGFVMSLGFAFNLFFLVMDLKVSSLLLDQLDILADKQALTMKVFCMVRQDIHRRVNNSKWAADFIAVPSVVSVLAILVILFTIKRSVLGSGIAYIISFMRSLLFISVAFWYVAKVNGKADALTLKLSTASWLRDLPDDQILDLGVVESRNRYDNMVSDMQRLSVYASGLADPISFTLLFKRVSWENVAVTALGFAATVVVALIKHAAEAVENS